jgi:CheY-like chemotaxis protein
LQAIRKTPSIKDIPIIFITAKVQKSEIEEYMQMGAIGTIIKPFDPMTLADEVNALWAEFNHSH